jgi:hypothetical protein
VLLREVGEIAGLPIKAGYLITDWKGEASLAVELITQGPWSFDAVATETRGGIGIARDITQNIDVGLYGTTRYDAWDPRLSLGVHARF